ncbi:MAG: pantetheine-phosphate adenylyltransferase [Candidatus Eremiobacteraeota bacterium]|nr:pantetheine-phosphate adenylyltransferase [Candidatus Eremiobacteraeota bacterium]MBC5826970.1 pantetheine-phosphate adenylyltransferase [Candidatus Eremiobacteraeota bacterium]
MLLGADSPLTDDGLPPSPACVIYPGSFDPVTNGHFDIVRRAARLFQTLIVAVVGNPGKSPMFGIEDRVAMLREACAQLPNVKVDSFTGLLADYVRFRQAALIIKGLRIVSDFEHEFSMALLNRKLEGGVETMFVPASLEYAYVSSSSVKEVFLLGGDIADFVPPAVLRAMQSLRRTAPAGAAFQK